MNILLVEDDPRIADFLMRGLRAEGHSVQRAAHGVEGLALAQEAARTAQPSDAPTYIGDTTLIASIWRTLKAGNVRAELRYGPPQRAGGMDRRTWAQVLRRDIGAMLD